MPSLGISFQNTKKTCTKLFLQDFDFISNFKLNKNTNISAESGFQTNVSMFPRHRLAFASFFYEEVDEINYTVVPPCVRWERTSQLPFLRLFIDCDPHLHNFWFKRFSILSVKCQNKITPSPAGPHQKAPNLLQSSYAFS